MKNRAGFYFASMIFTLVILTLTAAAAFYGLDGFGGNADGKSLKSIETAIKKAAVQCYAIEGSYPPDLDYLAEHYGIVLNKDVYFYHYDIAGSNIMPNIAVLKK